jgi:hypothetical protein
MGTRATIIFEEGNDKHFVYRGHDGYPDGNILQDIEAALKLASGRWSEPEVGLLVTLLLAMQWDFRKERLPHYEITSGVQGDESYLYSVRWNREAKSWVVRVLTTEERKAIQGYED